MSVTTDETFDWEDLLLYIRDGTVVPIIGRDLLVMTEADGRRTILDHHLASRLAAELKIPCKGLSLPLQLHEVALRYLAGNGAPQKIYSKLKTILDKDGAELPIPEPLTQLAAITDFNLFLSTTFDSLLLSALRARAGVGAETISLAYSPFRQMQDLPAHRDLEETIVYQIFGQATLYADYAVTEEDILEFMYCLQSEPKRPHNLFDALRDRHLLFLGCGFPDWLARFFIRTIKNERFDNQQREWLRYVADDRVLHDGSLLLFLKHYKTQVFIEGSAVDFVAELYRRWLPPPPASASSPTVSRRPMVDGAVFLSCAHEDTVEARRVRDALDAVGLDVWLDEREIPPGVDWEKVIQENIRRCSIFLPFVSRNTEAAAEGPFRVEWRLALQRAVPPARAVPFIHPIVLDDTAREGADVPAELRAMEWIRAPDGNLPREIVERLRNDIRRLRAP